MRARLCTTFLAAVAVVVLVATPAEAPAGGLSPGIEIARLAGSRLMPGGGHWAMGMALAFRR